MQLKAREELTSALSLVADDWKLNSDPNLLQGSVHAPVPGALLQLQHIRQRNTSQGEMSSLLIK